jgi:hypothetical protein
MINPLLRPQEVEKELQGDALVNQIQIRMLQQDIKSPAFNAYAKDVMETRGYPTKTMQEYNIEFPSTIGTLLPLAPMKADNQLNVTPPSVPLSEQTPMSGLPEAPKAIRSPGLPTTPTQIGIQDIETSARAPDTGLFNRVGQQLIGYDDQFSGINDRLNKIEQGIASLMQNRGQGLNMNTGGLGYFFNPFGGFYG